LRKPLIRRDKGDTLSLLVQFLLKLRVPSVCMYVFIKLHITAQSGPVIYSFYATVCNPPGGYLS
ncbi:unnamed protein product, partial [Ascophyllum nodosum]